MSDRTHIEVNPDTLEASVVPNSPWDHVCDFCGKGCVPLTEHPCRDVWLGAGHMSVGSWSACDTCNALIRTGQKDALLAFAVAVLSQSMDYDVAATEIRPVHEAFWSARLILGEKA